jgi:hypothetical protein
VQIIWTKKSPLDWSGLNPYQEETWRRQARYYTVVCGVATTIVVKTPMVANKFAGALKPKHWQTGLQEPKLQRKMTAQEPARTTKRRGLK